MCPYSDGKKLLSYALVFVLMALGCSREDSVTGPSEPNAATIYVDNTQQVIKGFGGQNMPGWIADLTAEQVQKAFGSGTGQLGLTIMRVRVPFDTTKFNLEVPSAQLATALGATIIASPWTPPASMKTNKNIIGGRLDTGSYAAFSAHLKAFADYLAANGAPLYAVSLQNEPDVSVSYESCFWSAAEMITFLRNNAPAIGTRIIVPESMNFNHALSDPILNDPDAAANVSIIGGHIYGSGLASYPLAVSKEKEVWMTEHLDTDTTKWSILGTAREINDCMNAGMNAYIWWYIRRFYGPMDDNGNITKRGYVLSQYARFVRPGFNRVAATANPQLYVYVTAYKNGAKLVIVVINGGPNSIDQTFILSGGSATTFTPYVTSPGKNCVQGSNIGASNGRFSETLDPYSVTTFVSN